ncbi:MAG TPA: DUF6178 family protein [Thermodesulfobacteriota bacterium]|nr:DUF6178 family protein [Thermodesulfobacteriota bacterium]
MVDSLPVTLPEDPKEAQRIFHSLSVENQLHLVLQARGKDRLRYLFLSEHPEQLVQQLPELEIFLTVKEAGEKDCLDLIALTTPEQFQFLLDLDFWKRDQLDAEKVLHWMEILLESGEKKVIQFIQSADIDFIALLLKKFIHATAVDGEPLEVMDKVAPFTLDQYHFVHFRGKRTREVFEPFLRVLYQANKGTYQRLMDSLTVELESELEETGYRLRNSRLKDYGFPDFEESLEIYRFLNPDAPLPEGRPLRPVVQEAAAKGNPIFYLAHQGEGPFFSSVLSKIDDSDEHNRLLQEIAALCNKAIVAEAIDLSNIVAMERVVKKVYHTLNLGLQYVSKDDDLRAVHILQSLPAQKLFQYGVSTTLLLRRKAESLLKGPWFSNDQENLVLLDPPHFETFEGILRRRPTLYRDWVYEDFKNPQDLKEADEFLEWLKTVITFLGNELKVSPLSLKGMDLSGCYPDDWREVTLAAIFLTALANQILRGTFQFEAIGQARAKDFLARVFERDDEGKGVMKMEVKNGLRDWLRSVEGEELKRQHLLAFQDFCLDLFEVQYGKIPAGEEVDPRFVKGLLIRK